MATRRTVKGSQTEFGEKQQLQERQTSSDTTPVVPSEVIYKLLGFTFAMIACPLATYFGTVNTVFKGNPTYAGGAAALAANVVLIAYVVVAMREDQADRVEAEIEKRTKKTD